MINEEAPTNSTGAPIAGIGVGDQGEPGVTRLTRKKPKKRRKYELSQKQMLQTEEKKGSYLPFKVTYDGQTDYIYYGRSENEVRLALRKIYRPESMKKLTIERVYQTDVINYYHKKRLGALRYRIE